MLSEIFAAIVGSGVGVAAIVFFAKPWLEARLRSSIEHEYKRQFEIFSRELDRKDKIELVAELIAEYMKIPKGETVPREQRLLLTKLSFKASLWLPGELAIELSKQLQNLPEAKGPFAILLLARKMLIDDQSISAEHITYWRPELEKKGDPVLVAGSSPNDRRS